MDAPGLPGCFPRFFFPARSAARRCFRGGFRPGRSSELGGIEEFPLFRDPARSAVSSCSRRPETVASSAAICPACAAISCACSQISASRGSSDGSPGTTSVTTRNHPGNRTHPPRQHHARRWNVTHDYSPQHQTQGPECLRFILYNVHDTAALYVLYILGNIGVVLWQWGMYAYIPPNFPTRMRSLGTAWTDGVGHLGAWGGTLRRATSCRARR